MPFEPLRFVHACGLFVDHQLHDLPQLPDDLLDIVQDATATAFERVVAAAIEHQADFVLLAGDSFCAGDCSLRAEVLIRRNFEKLAEHNIRVFVVAGSSDPAEAWRAIPELSDHFTSLDETNDVPVAVIRDGKVIASICSLDIGSLRGIWSKRESSPPKSEGQRGPLNIGIIICRNGSHAGESTALDEIAPLLADCQLDYLALGGIGERQTIAMKSGLAHHPGVAQAVGANETGPRGCTLIDVDPEGAFHSSYIPTAVVRRERCDVVVNEQTTDEQFTNQLQQALEQRKPEPGEKLWLVDWTIRGTGARLNLLENDKTWASLFEQANLSALGDVRLLHSVRVLRDELSSTNPTHGGSMLAEYLAATDGSIANSSESLSALFTEVAPTNQEWRESLEPLMREIDRESILAESRRLGMNWFAPAVHAAEESAT